MGNDRAKGRREAAEVLPTSVFLDRELLERVDGELERLRKEIPGASWSRSSVIRMALERYLERPLAERKGLSIDDG